MSLFKQPEYKRFELKPRYWDPQKEEREKRVRQARAELGLEDKTKDTELSSHIREQFRNEYERRKAMRSHVNSSRTIRLFMIIIMLFLAAFYLFIKNPDGLLKLFGL